LEWKKFGNDVINKLVFEFHFVYEHCRATWLGFT